VKDLSKLSITHKKMEWEERKVSVRSLLEMGIQGTLLYAVLGFRNDPGT